MSKSFSICIPTIGRKTIFSTLDSVCNTFSNTVELNIFLNGLDKTAISRHLALHHPNIELRIESTQEQIPMWDSIQRALSMGTGDYIWLLGDDDIVLPTANEALISISKLSIDHELIVWNGVEVNANGSSTQLIKLLPYAKTVSSPSAFLAHVYSELGYLNNGRFAVSKAVRDLMLQYNSGFQGTFHDEYGSLICAITDLIENKSFVSVCSPPIPAVGLGLVTKSWSNHHAQAILGEVTMLSRLSILTEPDKSFLVRKNLKRIRRLPFLIILRLINKEKIVLMDDLKFDVVLVRKVSAVNKIPRVLTRKLGPMLNHFYNSTTRIKAYQFFRKVRNSAK